MATDPLRYKPLHWSEMLLAVLASQPPYLGCGVSSACEGLDLATGGQFGLLANGRRKGRAARTNDLKRGWRAFKRVPDSNGIPDTDDYLRIHRALAPGLPDPAQLKTRDWSRVPQLLDRGYAISIAVRLSAVAGTKLARYTRADHQLVIWEPRLHWRDKSKRLCRNGQTKRIDPMHPHSDRYSGDVVDLADVRKAAQAIEGGLILGWIYPIGGWTAEELKADELTETLKAQRRTIDRLEQRRDTLKGLLDVANEERAQAIRDRDDALAELRDAQALNRSARAAGWEAAHAAATVWHDQQRVQGPPDPEVTP